MVWIHCVESKKLNLARQINSMQKPGAINCAPRVKIMYIFSANGRAKKAFDDIKEGQMVPFIVYINFKDLFGAEHLCKLYLMRAGFIEIDIENRKLVPSNLTSDPRVVAADKAMAEALKDGYMIQMFDE